MKKLMVAISLTMALASGAQTMDYVGMMTNINSMNVGTYINKENYKLVYDANIAANTNYSKCAIIAHFAYTNNWDRNLAFSFLEDNLENLPFNMRLYVYRINNLDIDRAMGIYRNKISGGNKELMLFALLSGKNANLTNIRKLSSENLEFLKSLITKEMYDSCNEIETKKRIVFNALVIDGIEKNYGDGFLAKLYDENEFIELISNGLSIIIHPSSRYDYTYLRKITEINVKYSKSIGVAIKSAKILDALDSTTRNIRWIFDNRSSTIPFKEKVDILDKVGTNDEKIDLFLEVDENQSPETIEWFIKFANALDVEYRQKDVLKILKNINSKYTLKLYDQRDAWEPVLSKIRAMIDVR